MSLHQVWLDYADHRFQVATSDAADIEWLLEFLLPDFEIAEAARSTPGLLTISLQRDEAAFDALRELGPHASIGTSACFSLDGRMDALPRWTSPEGQETVFDTQVEVFVIRETPGRVTIVARPGHHAARVILLRVVREVVTAGLKGRQREGGDRVLQAHAAAIALQGRGVVLAGPKRSGKTTLLLHLLTRIGAADGRDARLVANDRAVIGIAGGTAHVRGMPTIVSVRGSSLEFLPQLMDRFLACGEHHPFTLREGAGRKRPLHEGHAQSDWSLTPAQLARLVGARRSGVVPLSAIIFVRQTGGADGLKIARLSEDEAARRLAAAEFDSGPDATGHTFFDFVHEPAATAVQPSTDCVRAVAAAVPCFDGALGTDVYAGGGAAFIDAIDRTVEGR